MYVCIMYVCMYMCISHFPMNAKCHPNNKTGKLNGGQKIFKRNSWGALGNEIKENNVGGACGTRGTEYKCE
jgi:hypothetical protein